MFGRLASSGLVCYICTLGYMCMYNTKNFNLKANPYSKETGLAEYGGNIRTVLSIASHWEHVYTGYICTNGNSSIYIEHTILLSLECLSLCFLSHFPSFSSLEVTREFLCL